MWFSGTTVPIGTRLMAASDAPPLATPLSEAEPCGPDLEAEGDRDYMTVVARSQGELPGSYFEYLYPENEDDRIRIDFARNIGDLTRLTGRTHDLRVLVLRARFQILARDLQSFQQSVTTVAGLLDGFWSEVHPRAESDSVELRRVELDALDAPTVLFPLQYVPLCENRRIGPVSLRAWFYALNRAKPRTGEHSPSQTAILDALRDGDPDAVKQSRAAVGALVEAVSSIRAVWQEKTGESPPLAKLLDLSRDIAAMMDQAAPVPPAAPPTLIERASTAIGSLLAGKSALPAPLPSTDIETHADAAAALTAIAGYYLRHEPSSPALPLVEQALRLRGRSFYEALQVLLPSHADEATFKLGSQWVFELALSRIGTSEGESWAVQTDPEASRPSAKTWEITSRPQAVALSVQVAAFYRTTEPSSPIPLLLDRAGGLAERDFLTLLRDVLPKSALRDPAEE